MSTRNNHIPPLPERPSDPVPQPDVVIGPLNILSPMPTRPGLMPVMGSQSALDQSYDTINREKPFRTYCAAYPDAAPVCNNRTAPLAPYETLNSSTWDVMRKVNAGVNDGTGHPDYHVSYPKPRVVIDRKTRKAKTLTADDAMYGEGSGDVFTNPLSLHFKGPHTKAGTPEGDCDDIALAKQYLLIRRYGFRPENVLVAYAQNKGYGGIDHMVTLVLTDQGLYVMDMGNNDPVLLEHTNLHIRLVQDRHTPQDFVTLAMSGTTAHKQQGKNIYERIYNHDNYTRSVVDLYYVPTPPAIQVSNNGWSCKTEKPFLYMRQKISGTDIATYWQQNDFTRSFEIKQEPTPSSPSDAPKPGADASDPVITYTLFENTNAVAYQIKQTGKSLPKTVRKEADAIIRALANLGMVCTPTHNTSKDTSLPSLPLIETFAQKSVRDSAPITATR